MGHRTDTQFRKAQNGKQYSFPYYAGSMLGDYNGCYLYAYLIHNNLTGFFRLLKAYGSVPSEDGGRYEIKLDDLLKLLIIIIKKEKAIPKEDYMNDDYKYRANNIILI